MNKKHIRSNFDDFLKEEEIYKQTYAAAVKRLTVKINAKYQITIPQPVREKLNIKAGVSLIVDVQDGIIILIPRPKNGLHSEIWKSVDVQKYLDGERESWTNS